MIWAENIPALIGCIISLGLALAALKMLLPLLKLRHNGITTGGQIISMQIKKIAMVMVIAMKLPMNSVIFQEICIAIALMTQAGDFMNPQKSGSR